MTTYEAETDIRSHEPEPSTTDSDQPAVTEPSTPPGSAAFQAQYAGRDMAAGLIAGSMAIPLTVGIAMMSEYPIKVGLATVAFACLVGLGPGVGRRCGHLRVREYGLRNFPHGNDPSHHLAIQLAALYSGRGADIFGGRAVGGRWTEDRLEVLGVHL